MESQPTHIDIVPATPAHIPAITRIYADHVLHGTASFEETPPTKLQMLERFTDLQARSYPYLVALAQTEPVGFAYAGPHKARSAYRFTVEDSIYMDSRHQGLGVGGRLLQALITECRSAGFKQIMAVIGDSRNASSIGLHKALGFELVGVAKAIGYKHEQWRDVVYMQLAL